MTYIDALLYGFIQGVTEYLPISSSAHLILLPRFLEREDPGLTFDVFLHLGTLLATVVYFWKEWKGIMSTIPVLGSRIASQAPDGETVDWKLIVIATSPALLVGAILHGWVETVFRGNEVLIVTLGVGGLLLWMIDWICKKDRSLRDLTIRDALWFGIAQCLALVPGVSRSGATIAGGRVLGFDRMSAARFSFLMSAPVTAAAVVFELRNWEQLLQPHVGLGPLLVASCAAFVFGMVAIGGLLRLVRRFTYFSFFLYRVALAFVIWKAL